jgi:hypothetical protein
MVGKKQITITTRKWVYDKINEKLEKEGYNKIGRGYNFSKFIKVFLNDKKNIDLVKKYLEKKYTTIKADKELEKTIDEITKELKISKNKLITTIFIIFATNEEVLKEVLKKLE